MKVLNKTCDGFRPSYLNLNLDPQVAGYVCVKNEYLFKCFPVWLQNRLISAGLEPVLIHTERSCIASYFRKLFYG